MKYLVIACLLLGLTAAADAQSWVRVPPQTTRTLYGCRFDPADHERGTLVGWYLLAYDQISFVYNTTDGGHTLSDPNIYFQSGGMLRTAQAIAFTSSNVGYVAGTEIMKTTDGGTDWDIALDFGYVQGKFTELYFASPDSGYAVGEGWYGPTAMFFRTYNAGATWVQSDPPLDESTWVTCLARPSAHALYAGAGDTWGRTLFKSTNDGNSWTTLNTTLNFHSLCFATEAVGCAGTDTGIYRTEDGGASWSLVQGSATAVNCVRIRDGRGFAVTAGGGIYRTTDGGLSWSPMSSPVAGIALKYIDLLSASDAYAVGASGTILRYSDPAGVDVVPSVADALLGYGSPNPSDGRTRISYRVPETGDIAIRLYMVDGRLLRTLASGIQTAGTHDLELDVSDLVPGAYFYRLEAGSLRESRKLIIQR